MTIYRSTSEPPAPSIHPPRIQSPVGGAGHFDLPESDGTAEQHAADLPGFTTPWRGPRGHPIPESYSSASMLHFCAASREPTSNPISPSPAPTTPIRRGRRSRADGPVHNSGGGGRVTRCTRATRRHHPAFLCSIPGSARSPGRFHDSALKCSMRPANLSLADRCFGACGTAARRLRGNAAAPGGTRRQYPHLRPFSRARGKSGSHTTTYRLLPFAPVLARAREECRQWTEGPGNTSEKTPFYGVSSIPRSS